jgi:small subunit ribosomal protein S20
MANTKSAKKAVRQIDRRTAVNRQRRSKMRTFVRKVEEALLTGDQAAAKSALAAAEPVMMRAAQKGILHKNTASRKVSRLSARVAALAAKA